MVRARFSPYDTGVDAIGPAPGVGAGEPQIDDDFLSVLLSEHSPGTGTFEIGANGDAVEVVPENDYMPAASSGWHTSNLAEALDERELDRISSSLLASIESDINSRAPWIDRFRSGFEMMGLTADEVDDGPFPGSSTAVMPVISEAVVQFWARALAEQVPSGGPAKGTVLGKAKQAQTERARRVAEYMNHDMMFLDKSWYSDHSRMLFALPYTGSCFKKTYRDFVTGRNTGAYVQAEDFICNYGFTDLETAPRYTHRIWQSRNEVRKAQVAGTYRDVDISDPPSEALPEETEIKIEASDFEPGSDQNSDDARHELYEVYCEWNLPGHEDLDQIGRPTGIALPYIITIDRHSEKVLSIYRNWKEGDPLKRRSVNFVKYDYLPGPGFYGFGLLHMIGGLQQAATGSLRAIIDGAATASLQGGFISKDASMKDQSLTIEPGVWKQTDASAEDLGKAFFTPPFKEPSPVLFQIMGFLVQRAEKFAATTEMQTGTENSKNMPVGSTVAMIEAGSKVFSTIHRGLHKTLGEEMRQRYELIQTYMPEGGYPYDVEGGHEGVFAEDFAPGVAVIPVSDPNIFSQAQRVAQNQALYDLTTQNPDILKRPAVVRRVLEGLNVPDIDEIMISNDPPPPMDPVSEIQALLRGEPVQAYPDQLHQAYLQHYWAFMNNPQFGGNPQIQDKIGPAAVALLGQRLAYAWAEHVRALGVPATMLPPPIQPEGQQNGLMGPEGGQMPGHMPQVPAEQIAQMAAQIAPQMVQVPGLPSPQSAAEQAKAQAEAAKAQAEAEKLGSDSQRQQAEVAFKERELGLKELSMQQDIALKAKDTQLREADLQLKMSEAMKREQERAMAVAAEAEKQRRDEERNQQAILKEAQKAQQEDERHRQALIHAEERLQVDKEMARVKAAILAQGAEDRRKAAEKHEAQAKETASRTEGADNQTAKVMETLVDTIHRISGPKKVIRDASGKAIGIAPADGEDMAPAKTSKPKKAK